MGYRSRVYKSTNLGNGKRIVSSMDTGTYGILMVFKGIGKVFWYCIKYLCWYPIKYLCLLMYWMIKAMVKGVASLIKNVQNKEKDNID